MTNETANADPQQRLLQRLYVGLLVTLILQVVPYTLIAVPAMIAFLVLFTYCYVLRKRQEPDSLAEHHLTYLIRTIWIAGLILAACTLAGYLYVMHYLPKEDLMMLGDELMHTTHIQGPMNEFIRRNEALLIEGALIMAGPTILYIVYRFARGMARAWKGYRLASVKSWF